MFQDLTAFPSILSPAGQPGGQEVYVPHPGIASFRINIQPADAQVTVMSNGEAFKTYKAFTTNSGIVEGMRITVSGTGEVYQVFGRERYTAPFGPHYELVLKRPGV